MMNAKRRGNTTLQNSNEERVSLMGDGGGVEMTTKRTPPRGPTLSPPSSGNNPLFRREKRKTSALLNKGGGGPDDEERVSLIGSGAGGGRRPGGGGRVRPLRIADTSIKRRTFFSLFSTPAMNMSRMMRYIGMMLASATFSFLLLHRQSRTVHWEEYHKILEPDVGSKETRCFEQNKGTKDTRCTCPDPTQAISNTTLPIWMSHHKSMVHRAKNAPHMDEETGKGGLDVVFFGDDMIEMLSGSTELGAKDAEGMEEYFDRRFTAKGGGKLDAIALGSTGDIGPNMLWHLQNGILETNLRPKIWFIMVGGNDLFNSRCTDRFVIANTLNVVKALYNSQPDAEFVIHGIMPRVDNPDGKKGKHGELGHYWNRAQDINLQIKKFTRKGARLHYINGGPKFTKDTGIKGRKHLDKTLMKDGTTPTPDGMKVWGDFIEKKMLEILHPKNRLFKRTKAKERAKPKDEGEGRNLR